MDDDAAAALEQHRDFVLLDAAAARRLDEQAAADAAQLAGFARRAAARRKARPISLRLGRGQQARKIRAVEARAGRRAVRHLRLADDVAAAQFQRIDLQLGRDFVDQALDDVVGFRPARAAIGIGRRGVGDDLPVTAIHRLDGIGAGADELAVQRIGQYAGGRQISARVAQPLGAQRQELAFAVVSELAAQRDGAAVVIGEEILRAGGQPLHRALEHLRQMQHDRILRKRRGARAEGAADIDHAHAHAIRRNAGHDREIVAERGRALVGAIDVEAVGRGVIGDQRAAHFQRRRRHARAFGGERDDTSGAREGFRGFLRVAVFEIETDIAGDVAVDGGCAVGHRVVEADQDVEVFVVDLDQIDGVARGGGRLGDHDGDFLADETHAVARQDRTLRHQDALPAAARRRRDRRQGRKAGIGDIAAGENGEHAGTFRRHAGVDRLDDGMRVVGTPESGMDLSGKIPVVGVAALAGDQPVILAAAFEARIIRHSSRDS